MLGHCIDMAPKRTSKNTKKGVKKDEAKERSPGPKEESHKMIYQKSSGLEKTRKLRADKQKGRDLKQFRPSLEGIDQAQLGSETSKEIDSIEIRECSTVLLEEENF